MKKLLLIFILFVSFAAFADDDHDHKEDQEHGEAHDDHADEKDEHGHEGEHEEEESSAVVGPQKGILAKGEKGFQLSPEAIQTFNLKYQTAANSSFDIPAAGLVEMKKERFVYRLRDGWFKRIPVKILRKTSQMATIQISEFQVGDQLIVAGTGFVRTAEMVAEEGVSHGHSH